MVRVYSFQASGEASVNSSLQYKKGLPEMSAVTLCLWVRFRHFGAAYDTLVSYFTVGDDDMKLCKCASKDFFYVLNFERFILIIYRI